MFDSKFYGHQSMTLQVSYKMMFGYVQKLQIVHLIPLKATSQLVTRSCRHTVNSSPVNSSQARFFHKVISSHGQVVT